MSSPQEQVQAHCNNCSGETRHFVLHTTSRHWDHLDGDGDPWAHEQALYQTIRCCGCDEVKMKITSSSSGMYDTYVEYHPTAIFRRPPEWQSEIQLEGILSPFHKTLSDLLTEVYKALRNGMPRVAAMGVRAVLETIMVEKVGDRGSFKDNIDAFEAAGHIAQLQRARVNAVLDVGGAAIHRGYAPSEEDVIAMLNLTENLIESIYIHGSKIDAVAGKVPPRPPRLPRPPRAIP